jgi:hypothetical protein
MFSGWRGVSSRHCFLHRAIELISEEGQRMFEKVGCDGASLEACLAQPKAEQRADTEDGFGHEKAQEHAPKRGQEELLQESRHV